MRPEVLQQPARRLTAVRTGLFLLCAHWGGCVGTPKDTDETPRERCPYGNLEGYCAYEFGGPCPTYEEAAAKFCDLYHFDLTGTSTTPAEATAGGKECSFPAVECHHPTDPNVRTRFFFDDVGSGDAVAVDIIWPDTDDCPANGVAGQLPC